MSRVPSREERARRKANRLCIDCAAQLQPGDGLCCIEHDAIRAASSAKYRATAKARTTAAAAQKRRYSARVDAGLCIVNGCPQAAKAGLRRCQGHHDLYKVLRIASETRHEEGRAA